MSYSDETLVEKLREILIRLYPTPMSTHPGYNSGFNSHKEKENILKSESENVLLSPLESDNVRKRNDTDNSALHTFPSSGSNHMNFEHPLMAGRGNSEEIGGKSMYLYNGDPLGNHSWTIKKNLQEFIHVLKMSLSSDDRVLPSESGDRNDMITGGDINARQPDFESYGHPESLFNGGMVSSTPLEYNLTMEDISSFNSLMEDSSVIQWKHVVILSLYFLIACVSILGNLIVVQVSEIHFI